MICECGRQRMIKNRFRSGLRDHAFLVMTLECYSCAIIWSKASSGEKYWEMTLLSLVLHGVKQCVSLVLTHGRRQDLFWLDTISTSILDRSISVKLNLPLFGPDNHR